jgi:predicted enzyme related to lactoylglutathione lyase
VKTIYPSLFSIILIFTLSSSLSLAEEGSSPQTNSSVTFLYYKDLTEAKSFYADVLGLKKDFDGNLVKIFKIAEGGRVRLIDEKKGHFKSATDKPVMISIDTSAVRLWYERVKITGPKYKKTHLKPESDGFTNSFLMTDPAGYTVEFFQWNKVEKTEEYI